jgi:diacylglycerol kinase (ATP)
MATPTTKKMKTHLMQKLTLKRRLYSFRHAFNGILRVIVNEPNAWIHSIASMLAVAFAFFIGISPIEWVAITVAIALVWITEIINSSIEKLCNHVETGIHPSIKAIKDMAAGAVLAAAAVSVAIALLIFIPKL